MVDLKKLREKAFKAWNEQHIKNEKAESLLRKEYKKVSMAYTDNMETYDKELKTNTKDNENTKAEYDGTIADLNNMKEEYNMLLEEKRKRDEIAAIMQKKKDEQNEKMNKLIKASEYI